MEETSGVVELCFENDALVETFLLHPEGGFILARAFIRPERCEPSAADVAGCPWCRRPIQCVGVLSSPVSKFDVLLAMRIQWAHCVQADAEKNGGGPLHWSEIPVVRTFLHVDYMKATL